MLDSNLTALGRIRSVERRSWMGQGDGFYFVTPFQSL